MKALLAFLLLVAVAVGAPVTTQNNLVIQNNGTAISGVLLGNGAGVPISGITSFAGGTTGQVLSKSSNSDYAYTWMNAGGAGTVTSVGLSLPAIFTVTNSPVTSSGTLTGTLANQTANLVWAGPASGANAPPTFRSLVASDMPAGTGTVTSFSSGNLSPLFTTNVATATTTPALTFALSTQAANRVFAGPSTGADAAPTFRALVAADIPADVPTVVITDDTTTNATMYPTWVTANTGNLSLKVASTKFSFNPSTGRVTSTAGTIGSIGLASNSLTNVSTLTSPALTDMLVGTGTFGTSLTLASATGIPTFATNVVFSGTTLTVPDLFNINGAGAISLTAGGSNKNVTLKNTTGTSGNFVFDMNGGTTPTPVFSGIQLIGRDATQAAYQVDVFGANARGFVSRRANGTIALPSAVQNTNLLLQLAAGGYGSTDWSSSRASIAFNATENWTDSVAGQKIRFSTVNNSGRASGAIDISETGTLVTGIGSLPAPAWGVSGLTQRSSTGMTYTDATSATGTVASAVFNSFATPTISATNANVVYTNLANLYIAGDVATAGNASATNSYGLWNVGKTRLDGAVQLPSTNTAGLQLYNTTDQVTNYERLELLYSGNVAQIFSRAAGTGTLRQFNIGNTNNVLTIQPGSATGGSVSWSAITSSLANQTAFRFISGFTQTSGTQSAFSLTPTYNQASGTAANTDLLINRTETLVGSGAQLLIDAQVGGVSKFSVSNTGTITSAGGHVVKTNVQTTTYTITTGDYFVAGNSATPFTITMIAASSNTGRTFVIKNKNTGTVTLDATALGTIDGSNTINLTTNQSVTLISDGTQWNVN